jgi:hypothetical protein
VRAKFISAGTPEVSQRYADDGFWEKIGGGGKRGTIYKDLSSLGQAQRLFRSVGAFSCSVGGFLGFIQAFPHILRLSPHCPELHSRKDYKTPSKKHDPPIARRFMVAVLAVILAHYVNRIGYVYVDRGRELYGKILIGSSLAIVACGLGLFWLSDFTSTWGWWL